MAEDHLVADLREGIGDVEIPVLLAYACIEYKVVEQIAYFLCHIRHIISHYGIAELIDFFFRHRAYGVHSLSGIPGALFPQAVHHVKQSGEGLYLFFFCVHR